MNAAALFATAIASSSYPALRCAHDSLYTDTWRGAHQATACQRLGSTSRAHSIVGTRTNVHTGTVSAACEGAFINMLGPFTQAHHILCAHQEDKITSSAGLIAAICQFGQHNIYCRHALKSVSILMKLDYFPCRVQTRQH